MKLFRQREASQSEQPSKPAPLRDRTLLARWYVMHRLHEEIERARRYERPLSIILAQPAVLGGERLDERALDAAAQAALSAARATDLAGWLGGDNIVIILPETTGEHARFAAARLRDEMWIHSRAKGGQKWTVTAIDQLDEVAAAFASMPGDNRAA